MTRFSSRSRDRGDARDHCDGVADYKSFRPRQLGDHCLPGPAGSCAGEGMSTQPIDVTVRSDSDCVDSLQHANDGRGSVTEWSPNVCAPGLVASLRGPRCHGREGTGPTGPHVAPLEMAEPDPCIAWKTRRSRSQSGDHAAKIQYFKLQREADRFIPGSVDWLGQIIQGRETSRIQAFTEMEGRKSRWMAVQFLDCYQSSKMLRLSFGGPRLWA